jgi:hypothetical protein
MSKGNNDLLYTLIRSLGRTEKRYFKVYSARHVIGEENTYVKLFDAIEAQKTYNEEVLRKQHQFQNFRSMKNRLYNTVLRAMQDYHSGINIEVKNELNQIEILYNKSLFPHCMKLIHKVKESCKKFELFELILEALKWEYRVAIKEYDINVCLQVLEEERHFMKLLHNQKIYRDLANNLSLKYQQYGAERNSKGWEDMKNILNNPYLKTETKALSIRALENYCSCFILYNLNKENFEKIYHYSTKLINIYHAHSYLISFYATSYLTSINYCLIAAQGSKKYDEMRELINMLQEKRKNLENPSDKATAFYYLYHLFNYYSTTGLFNEGEKDIAQVEKEMEEHLTHLSDHRKSILLTTMSQVYFGLGNYKKCLQSLNKIFSLNEVKRRKDIESFNRLFYIIVHYEMKSNTDFLLSLFKSTYRHIYKSQRLYKFESIMMEFIKETILKGIKKKDIKSRFIGLKSKLELLEKDKFEKLALQHFDFIAWLESKIENRPFAEIVKERMTISKK